MTSSALDNTDKPTGTMTTAAAPIMDSRELFGGHRRLTIRHGDNLYRLQITRQGKLILTR